MPEFEAVQSQAVVRTQVPQHKQGLAWQQLQILVNFTFITCYYPVIHRNPIFHFTYFPVHWNFPGHWRILHSPIIMASKPEVLTSFFQQHVLRRHFGSLWEGSKKQLVLLLSKIISGVKSVLGGCLATVSCFIFLKGQKILSGFHSKSRTTGPNSHTRILLFHDHFGGKNAFASCLPHKWQGN